MSVERRRSAVRWACGVTGLALAPAPLAIAVPTDPDYRLVFADEFNGSSLDASKWVDAYPWSRTHNHDAYVAPENVILGDGTVTLKAERRAQGGKAFTSGAISTGYTKYKFDGGYVEARMKLPSTPGSWAAFWGLDNGWPPEADIMEAPLTTDGGASGYNNSTYHTAFHYANGSGGNSAGAGPVNPASAGDLTTAYHTFAMNWVSDTSVTFLFDGQVVSSFNNAAVAQMSSMYLIFNYAVGGWPGTPSMQQWAADHSDEFKIDWVHVFQKNGGADAPSSWNINGNGAFGTGSNWTAGVPRFGNQTAVFGRVGNAATSAVSLNPWHVFGGITFDGAGGAATAYTIGTSASQIQLASTAAGGATVQATAASTVSQTINARLELWNNTTFKNDMTGGQTLNVNSEVTGSGALTADGVGTTVLSSTNAYTGGTVIGSGQGPAVLRANASGALGTGGVVIGTAGNASTARLEVVGNRTLANNIDLRGRNNSTPGILNLSGNNTLSGTISANLGGGSFVIQSDADTLTLSGAAPTAAAAGVALQAGTGARLFTLQGVGNGAITGKVQNGGGNVSILKLGSGTWTLSGANTYTGTTTVGGGKLALNHGGITSSIGVSAGATLNARGNLTSAGVLSAGGTVDLTDAAANAITASTLNFNTATLNFELGNGTTADRIASTGAATVVGVNTVNLAALPGQGIGPGSTYTLITAAGGLNAANFVLGAGRPASLGFNQFSLSTPTANALQLAVTGNPTPAVAYWTGQGSTSLGEANNNWGSGAGINTSNWSTDAVGANDPHQLPGASTQVIFTAANAAAAGTSTSTQLDSAYAIKGLTVDVPAASPVLGVFLNTNGHALSIGSGGLSVATTSNASAIVGGAGGVQVDGHQAWSNHNDARSLDVQARISAVAGATTLTFDGTGTGGVNLSGVLANGGGTLSTVFNQAGTSRLTAANTYTGTTTVAGGVVELSGAGKIVGNAIVGNGGTLRLTGGTDAIADAAGVDVQAGGVLDVRATESIARLNGAGTVTRGTAGTTVLTVGANDQSGNFGGQIQNGNGQVALVKAGSGTQTLSGFGTYSGGTTINDNGGTLLVTHGGALGTGNVTIGNGASNATGTLQLAGGIALSPAGAAAASTINLASRDLSTAGGAPQIDNLSGNNIIAAHLNINNTGGTAANIRSTAGKLTLGGNLSSTGQTSARGFNFYGAGDGLVAGVISNNTAQPTFVQKDGAGTWTLSGNNTFTGDTTVNAGTLVLSGNNNFGGGGVDVNGGTAVLSGSNVFTGGTNVVNGVAVLASTTGLGSINSPVTLGAGGTLVVQTDGSDRAYNLNVGSGNAVTVASDVKTGSIGINHTLGTLAIGRDTTVNVTAGANVASGSAAITLGNVTLTAGTGAGSTTFNPTSASVRLGAVTTSTNSAKTLILDGTSAGNAVNGAISNGSNVMTVVKADTSVWALTAGSSYTGGTTVNDGGGALLITHGGALGSGPVTIGNGGSNQSGVLQLSGGITVTSVPTINFASRLLSTAGGAADIENVSGNNTLSANFNINNAGGNAVNILSSSGKLTLSGTLSSTGLGSARGYNFYGAGDGAVIGPITNGTAQQTFVQKAGLGTWSLTGNNSYSGTTTIAEGTLRASNNAYTNLLTNAGGTDLTGNSARLVLDYTAGGSPVAAVKAILDAGYATNFTIGKLRSTTATATRGLGYGDNGTSVTIMATLYGDANLDGKVSFNDFLVLQANFGAMSTRFDQGNFNYDGTTNFNDFLILQANFGKSVNGSAAITADQMAAVTAFANAYAVPEPASLAVLGLGAAGLLGRRRKVS